MIKKATIIPTGDEILNGTVIDTNSPAIMGLILERFPACEIRRLKPVEDMEQSIAAKLAEAVAEGADLIFLIGGSGGGHRFSPTLSRDYTHTALLEFLPEAAFKEIYGKNGHLWSKLIVGRKEHTLIVTVPGPYIEAVAAAKEVLDALQRGERDPEKLVTISAQAVFNQYPSGGEIR